MNSRGARAVRENIPVLQYKETRSAGLLSSVQVVGRSRAKEETWCYGRTWREDLAEEGIKRKRY